MIVELFCIYDLIRFGVYIRNFFLVSNAWAFKSFFKNKRMVYDLFWFAIIKNRFSFNLFLKVFYINFNNNTPKRQAESVIKRLCDSTTQTGS